MMTFKLWMRSITLILWATLAPGFDQAFAHVASLYNFKLGVPEALVGSWPRPRAVSKTVLVQMFEWPWNDLGQECEKVLGPMGVAAIQVSPPQEHLVTGQNAWWERYQPVSFDLVSRSGNKLEFQNMVRRCQAAGVDVYVDVILNHMAGIASGYGFNGTPYTKYHHPGLFSPVDFHFCGRHGDNQIQDYEDRYELQFCELLGLADLKTESPAVQTRLVNYLNRLLDLGVAGFRLDAAKHVPARDLSAILANLKSPAYLVSETFIGPGDPVTVNEYTGFSDVNYFPYAYDLARMLRGGYLAQWRGFESAYPRSDLAVVFVENHDTQRERPQKSLSREKESALFELAEVFMLTWPYGYPQIYSGYEFSDYNQGPPIDAQGVTLPVLDGNGHCKSPWLCEHRRPAVQELVRFRNQTDGAFRATQLWSNRDEVIAFSRGSLGFVVINSGLSQLNARIPTDLADGDYVDLLSKNTRAPFVVSVRQGKALTQLPGRRAIVLLSSEKRTP